ncbi:MAG: hypothetical protein GDA50_00870 [Alphaproteobacteria bacterium GM202ARS2]|nr:hypothetical protein [Alphaproteobacteria bacterium GM202ARS2]
MTDSYCYALHRQTPNNDGVWKTIRVSFNNEKGCSWLCVYDTNQPSYWLTTIPKHRRILVIIEPKEIFHYSPSCLAQYGTVISPYPRPSSYKGQWLNKPILFPWIYGYKEYEPLSETMLWQGICQSKPHKTKTLSVIFSKKSHSPMQVKRTQFIQALKQELGNQLDIFGRNNTYIPKEKGIDPYRYHLVIENGTGPHFWSEKLADCYLGEAYAIHAGCSNLHDYFPREAYTSIDIFNVPSAIQKIKEVIASDVWQKNRPHILEAKRRVMENNQLFPVLESIIRSAPQSPESPDDRPLPQPVALETCVSLLKMPLFYPSKKPRPQKYFSLSYARRRLSTIRNSITKRLPFFNGKDSV